MMRINATGGPEALPDTLVNVKFSSTGWTPDDKVRAQATVLLQHQLCVWQLPAWGTCAPACWDPMGFGLPEMWKAEWGQAKGWPSGNPELADMRIPDILRAWKGPTSAYSSHAELGCGARAQGFFYNRYTPIGNATGQSTGANKDQQLWYHVVGTPQAQDTFVLALPEQPDWSLGAGVTDDEKCAQPAFYVGRLPSGSVELPAYTQRRQPTFDTIGCLVRRSDCDGSMLTPPSRRTHIVVSVSTGTDPTNLPWLGLGLGLAQE